ncbi:unnamed protein product [Schistocephalus solidus]|uniref:Chromosome 1 open reading frame 56 n=1 Tax=Schistocephalus solidus TaxID=70667 RepID=A0A183SVW2_SCHSO|nr:unnamed protein product [Schistocephalus solidus]
MVNDTEKPKPTHMPGPIGRLPTDTVTTGTPSSRRRQRSGQKRFRPPVMNGAISEWRSKVRRLQEINRFNLAAQRLQITQALGKQPTMEARLLHSPCQQKAERPSDMRLVSALGSMEEEPVNLSKSSSLCTSPSAKDKTLETSPHNPASNNSLLFSPPTPTTSSSPQWDFDYWLRHFRLPEYSAKLASQLHCSTIQASIPPRKPTSIQVNTPEQASHREAPAHPQAPSALLTQLLFLGSLLPCLLRGGTSGSTIQRTDSEPTHRPTNALSQ